VRTTVSLEADLAAKLRTLARERGISFKDALNGALRDGLSTGRVAAPYTLRTRVLGLRRGVDLDKGLALAGQLEDAETLRKLELRK